MGHPVSCCNYISSDPPFTEGRVRFIMVPFITLANLAWKIHQFFSSWKFHLWFSEKNGNFIFNGTAVNLTWHSESKGILWNQYEVALMFFISNIKLKTKLNFISYMFLRGELSKQGKYFSNFNIHPNKLSFFPQIQTFHWTYIFATLWCKSSIF